MTLTAQRAYGTSSRSAPRRRRCSHDVRTSTMCELARHASSAIEPEWVYRCDGGDDWGMGGGCRAPLDTR
jgi:hypothetical protein